MASIPFHMYRPLLLNGSRFLFVFHSDHVFFAIERIRHYKKLVKCTNISKDKCSYQVLLFEINEYLRINLRFYA